VLIKELLPEEAKLGRENSRPFFYGFPPPAKDKKIILQMFFCYNLD
jgi:hypothetical protein